MAVDDRNHPADLPRPKGQADPGGPGGPGDSGDPGQPGRAVPAIEVRGPRCERGGVRSGLLHRARPPVLAVDDVSFTVRSGEAVALVGTPGAGKTTVVETLTGVLTPTGGTVRVCGLAPDLISPGPARKIGAVFADRSQLWSDLTISDSLRVLAGIHRLPRQRWIGRRTELVERLGLAPFLELPVRLLPPAARVHAEVAAALLHEPELLVLDQPALDLDAPGRERLRSFLRQEHRVHGRTILITSAGINDVEQFCDRLLVIDQGRLAYDGDLPGLVRRTGPHRVLVVDLTEPDHLLDDVPGTRLLVVEDGGLRQRLSVSPGAVSTARLLAEVAARGPIRQLTVEEPPLGELVRRLTPAST